jgi:hypothetical protein
MKLGTTRQSRKRIRGQSGIENPHNAGFDTMSAMVCHRHRFGEALGLVIAPRGRYGLT